MSSSLQLDRERVRGAVLGAAIGDALGHPTEFIRSFEEIRARFGPRGVDGYALYWERDGKRFAPYTDDTQMAEIVLRGLVESRRLGESLDAAMERMGRGFVTWDVAPQGGHRAPGQACLAGARRLAAGCAWSEAGASDAGGCGSVMRAWPFGIAFHSDPTTREEWAVAHSRLTHGAPIALAACAALAHGMASALAGEPHVATTRVMAEAARRHDTTTAEMITAACADAAAGRSPDDVLSRLQGWAAHEAVAAAAYVFVRHPDDFRGAVLEAANTPGDSDSIATLAGALVGGRCGVGAIPESWVRDVERGDELVMLADQAVEAFGGTG